VPQRQPGVAGAGRRICVRNTDGHRRAPRPGTCVCIGGGGVVVFCCFQVMKVKLLLGGDEEEADTACEAADPRNRYSRRDVHVHPEDGRVGAGVVLTGRASTVTPAAAEETGEVPGCNVLLFVVGLTPLAAPVLGGVVRDS